MFFFDTDVDLLKVAPAYALQEKMSTVYE